MSPKFIRLDDTLRYLELVQSGSMDRLESVFEAIGGNGELQILKYLRDSLRVSGFIELNLEVSALVVF